MKTKEFKKAIEGIGRFNGKNLKVTENDCEFYIQNGNTVLAIIDKTANCLIDTCYQDFSELEESLRQILFDKMYEFVSTPPEERQEEKRYIIPLPHLTLSDGEQLYLTHQGNFFPHVRNTTLRQTWKEKDLSHIPEEYRNFAVETEEER